MKTLSFHELEIGRGGKALLSADTESDGVALNPGLHLLVAPNGFGKTTFLQTLAGVLAPRQGQIRLDGKSISFEKSVLYVSEYLNFPKFLYASEWIELMSADAEAGHDIADQARWIEGFSMGHKMGSFLGRMSQGERRKVTWLGAHASRKPVVLLDEPLDGLDLLAIRCARALIEEWKNEGRIVLAVAHQVGEILDLADSVWLLRDRRLISWQTQMGESPATMAGEVFRRKALEFYSG